MNGIRLEDYLSKVIKNDPTLKQRLEREGQFLDIGFQIYDRRKERGLSQSALAKKAGTTQQQISRLESAGYRGTLSLLERVADALDLKLEIRLAEPEQEKPKKSKRKNYKQSPAEHKAASVREDE